MKLHLIILQEMQQKDPNLPEIIIKMTKRVDPLVTELMTYFFEGHYVSLE